MEIRCFQGEQGSVGEFQEEQHSKPSPFFDRRQTMSDVGRGEQRRLDDERKRRLIPAHGRRLVLIEKSELVVRSSRIVRNRWRELFAADPPGGAHLQCD